MFDPKFTITNQLLANIKHINSLIKDLNIQHFPNIVLYEFERVAREVSTYASTSIEGNPLPLTEVKKILKNIPTHLRNTEKEVVNYNEALIYLNKTLNKTDFDLTIPFILSLHANVVQGLLPKYQTGKFRVEPVVVNDPRTGNVVYLPPNQEDIMSLIRELLTFLHNNQDIDSIIMAGLFHKHMVIIHPFIDGNDRTTRLITKALLAKIGLNTFNLFSFENYYNQNVTKYFNTVGVYGDYYEIKDGIDFTPWLEYFTAGIIDELLRVQKSLPQRGLDPESELKKYHKKIIEYIQQNGYITDQDYSHLTKRAKSTRSLDFHKLIELDIIKRQGQGRSSYYTLKEN